MKKLQFTIIALGFVFLAGIRVMAQSGTVRGRLIELSSNDTLSVPSVAITLVDSTDNRTMPTYSGSDGMYSFNEVVPQRYTLEIWVNGLKKDPALYQIKVAYLNNNHFFDIAPIVVKRNK